MNLTRMSLRNGTNVWMINLGWERWPFLSWTLRASIHWTWWWPLHLRAPCVLPGWSLIDEVSDNFRGRNGTEKLCHSKLSENLMMVRWAWGVLCILDVPTQLPLSSTSKPQQRKATHRIFKVALVASKAPWCDSLSNLKQMCKNKNQAPPPPFCIELLYKKNVIRGNRGHCV